MAAASVKTSADQNIGRTAELHDITASQGLLQDLDIVHKNPVGRVLHRETARGHADARSGGAGINNHAQTGDSSTVEVLLLSRQPLLPMDKLGQGSRRTLIIPQDGISETNHKVYYSTRCIRQWQKHRCNKDVKPHAHDFTTNTAALRWRYVRTAQRGRFVALTRSRRTNVVRPPPSVLTTTSACRLEMDLMGATSRTTFTSFELRPMVVDLPPASATVVYHRHEKNKTQGRGKERLPLVVVGALTEPFLVPAYSISRHFWGPRSRVEPGPPAVFYWRGAKVALRASL